MKKPKLNEFTDNVLNADELNAFIDELIDTEASPDEIVERCDEFFSNIKKKRVVLQ